MLSVTNNAAFVSQSARARLSTDERLRWLEAYGQVPDDADDIDWQLASRTSWWGKRLDSNQFWTNRTIWLDKSARAAARKVGRRYPPMPYDDPQVANRPHDKDVDLSGSWEIEGPNLRFRFSERESVFWNTFVQSHPRTPEDIERQQLEVAQRMVSGRREFETRNRLRRTAEQLTESERAEAQQYLEMGYPAEPFSQDALFWAYVQKKRHEYEELSANFAESGLALYSQRLTNLLQRLPIEPKYITDPLTDEQVQTANGWKVAYLQRLKRENKDESYINAYLKAWNLSPQQVFAQTNRP